MHTVRAFIQARMTSERLPGKVLCPFRGRPMVDWVLDGVRQVLPHEAITLLTSNRATDDPLAAYVRSRGFAVFRGPEKQVFSRFQMALNQQPCDWVMRISADSPLVDAQVLHAVIDAARDEWDLITTIYPRTFPKGKNAELIRAQTLLKIRSDSLTANEAEHVTPVFYLHPERYRIFNVTSGNPHWSDKSLAVDTLDDLRRLERMSIEEITQFQFQPKTLKTA